MRRLVIADAEIMRLAIQQEIVRSEESRYDHRLHGVLFVSHGLSCSQVADWLGQHPRTVERWVHLFDTRGFAGLQEGERSGRPARLTPRQVAAVGRVLRGSPRARGYAQTLWDGKLLAHHVAETYGAVLGVRQCQRLFHAGLPATQAALSSPRRTRPPRQPSKTPPPRPRSRRGSVESG
jgi:transposase